MLEQLIADEENRLKRLKQKSDTAFKSDPELIRLRKKVADAQAELQTATDNHSGLNALALLIDQQEKSITALKNPIASDGN